LEYLCDLHRAVSQRYAEFIVLFMFVCVQRW